MDEGTTLWIDKETRNNLRILAEANSRSVAGQIRWMVKVELLKLATVQPADGNLVSIDCAE
jgi:hypothetical protein